MTRDLPSVIADGFVLAMLALAGIAALYLFFVEVV
jgi:hypothetical protein